MASTILLMPVACNKEKTTTDEESNVDFSKAISIAFCEAKCIENVHEGDQIVVTFDVLEDIKNTAEPAGFYYKGNALFVFGGIGSSWEEIKTPIFSLDIALYNEKYEKLPSLLPLWSGNIDESSAYYPNDIPAGKYYMVINVNYPTSPDGDELHICIMTTDGE